MKDFNAVKKKVTEELQKWAKDQANAMVAYYLYYRPVTKSNDSNLIICQCENAPPGYKLAMTERINGFETIEWNFNRCLDVLRKLPLLH